MLKLKFASNEKEFVYNMYVNKGHTQVATKITRCLFLSSNAKQLYTHILSYAYTGRDHCFLEISRLLVELGYDKRTFNKYLKELVEAGFIRYESDAPKTLYFVIEELHKIPMLVHSEVVYSAKGKLTFDKFAKLLKDYKVSDLCAEIEASDDPSLFLNEVCAFFGTVPHENIVTVEASPVSDEDDGYIVVPEPKLPAPPPPPKYVRPTAIPERGTSVPIDSKGVSGGLASAIEYFREAYQIKYDTQYNSIAGDRKNLSTLLKKKTLDEVLMRIDVFMELDFFETKTLRAFSSAYSQAVLDKYLVEGTLPKKITSSPTKPSMDTAKTAMEGKTTEQIAYEGGVFRKAFLANGDIVDNKGKVIGRVGDNNE